MNELVASVSPAVPFKVIMAAPELEYVFFEAPGLLKRLYPALPDFDLFLYVAKSNTRNALKKLDPTSPLRAIQQRLLDEVKDEDLPALRQTKVIHDLIDFLHHSQSRRVKISVQMGPGFPSDLYSLKTPDGLRALLDAFVKTLTTERLAAGAVLKASSGTVTVYLDPQHIRMQIEPPGNLFSTFVLEVEGEAKVEERE
jgi:hypothetical protein